MPSPTAQKPSKVFGGGSFYGINNVPSPTPTTFDTLQDMSISMKRETKSLWGTNQFADDVSSGQMSVTGKVTCGSLNSRAMSDLLVGSASKSEYDKIAKKEIHVTPNDGIIKVANAAGYEEDLGLIAVATNKPLVRVPEGTTLKANTYTVSAKGNYKVDATTWDDLKLAVSYRYVLSGATDTSKQTLLNAPMGDIGDFTAVMAFEWKAEQNVFVLNSCNMSDFELASKQGDYGKPSWSFMAAVDDYDVLGTFSFAQRR